MILLCMQYIFYMTVRCYVQCATALAHSKHNASASWTRSTYYSDGVSVADLPTTLNRTVVRRLIDPDAIIL